MPALTENERIEILRRAGSFSGLSENFDWLSRMLTMPDALSHPLIRILRFDRTDNCLSDLTSDLERLRDTSGLSEITARMANYRQFLYERSSLRLASGYKRRGFEVTFIHEGSEPRPDFKIRSYDLNRSAIFEVKHLSGRTTLETMILDVEDTISPYIVIVTTELLQLDSQAHYLAQRIAGEIQRLGSAEITYENRYVVDLGYTKFEIFTKQQGQSNGPHRRYGALGSDNIRSQTA